MDSSDWMVICDKARIGEYVVGVCGKVKPCGDGTYLFDGAYVVASDDLLGKGSLVAEVRCVDPRDYGCIIRLANEALDRALLR